PDTMMLLMVQSSKTPLHFACCRGDPKAIIQALQDGFNVNAPDDKLCTPLHVAARYNHTEVCRFLMSQGADPNTKDNAGRTP
ncbi:ankyrin repeat-containing domain protein, partial [Baffinella frigidus]